MCVRGLNCHPCKRRPIPFIYVSLCLSDGGEVFVTKKSNGLPPTWTEQFRIPINRVDSDSSLIINFMQSRLFMSDESIGKIILPIEELLRNGGLSDWIPFEENSSGQVTAHVLISTTEISEDQEPEEKGNQPPAMQNIYNEFFAG